MVLAEIFLCDVQEKNAQQAYGANTGPKKFWAKKTKDPAGGTRKQRKKKRAGRMKQTETKVDEDDLEEWDDNFSVEPEDGDGSALDKDVEMDEFGDEHSKIDPTPRGSHEGTPREENALLGGDADHSGGGGGGGYPQHDPNDDRTSQETEIYYNDLLTKGLLDIEVSYSA